MSSILNRITEQNDQLIEMLKKTNLDRQTQMDIQRENLALRKIKEENKILFRDLDTIADPKLRDFFQAVQERIMHKRTEQYQQGPSSITNAYDQYFDDIGGFGTDLPEN